ncbi:uncharacterized protein LOC143291596 [Babylonia areolata]|uniref:uncharacterized protein LOC143291596 n=1 Tax=Babylonia areolata TaxID=304850 RepID=UPI003FCF8CB7
MFPGNGWQLLALSSVVVLLWGAVAPVSGDFATYQKFGTHAYQMQKWKKAEVSRINNLKSSADLMFSQLEGINATIQEAIAQVGIHVEALNQTMNTLSITGNFSGGGYRQPPSAFQAYISASGSYQTETNSIPYKYANKVLDINNDFNTVTGLFTAPYIGLYYFHATYTCSSGKHEAVFKVKKANGPAKVIAYMKYNYGQETAATAMTILHPGDTVGVYPKYTTGSSFSMPGGEGNTFMGYQMAEFDDPDYDPNVTAAPNPPTPAPTFAPAPGTTSWFG